MAQNINLTTETDLIFLISIQLSHLSHFNFQQQKFCNDQKKNQDFLFFKFYKKKIPKQSKNKLIY